MTIQKKVKAFLHQLDFEIFEIDEVDTFINRKKHFEVDGSILILEELVREGKTPQMSTLHIFED